MYYKFINKKIVKYFEKNAQFRSIIILNLLFYYYQKILADLKKQILITFKTLINKLNSQNIYNVYLDLPINNFFRERTINKNIFYENV